MFPPHLHVKPKFQWIVNTEDIRIIHDAIYKQQHLLELEEAKDKIWNYAEIFTMFSF
jgi:hypothetical protein